MKNKKELITSILSYIGIGALCVISIISLVIAFLPNGNVAYAILGAICITSASSIALQLAILNKDSAQTPAVTAEAENKGEELDAVREQLNIVRRKELSAKNAVSEIKGILSSVDEITSPEVRAQRLYNIKDIITRIEKATNGAFYIDESCVVAQINEILRGEDDNVAKFLAIEELVNGFKGYKY